MPTRKQQPPVHAKEHVARIHGRQHKCGGRCARCRGHRGAVSAATSCFVAAGLIHKDARACARWSIGEVTPVEAFGAWYTQQVGAWRGEGGGDVGNTSNTSKLTQACDFGCNLKCPLFT